MKRLISILMVLVYIFAFSACTQEKEPNNTAAAPQDPPAVETVTQSPVYVSEHAVEYFLEPVNAFSWKRQHAPEIVMIHFMSAVMTNPEDPYNLSYTRKSFVDYDVSIHYIILRDGTIQCLIPESRVAWHAGPGEYNADPRYTNAMNHYAIGIELFAIGSESDMAMYMTPERYQALDDSLKGFTEAQYEALTRLVTDICRRNSIPMDREHVIGHDDYAPGKTDPGELFDWNRLLGEKTA